MTCSIGSRFSVHLPARSRPPFQKNLPNFFIKRNLHISPTRSRICAEILRKLLILRNRVGGRGYLRSQVGTLDEASYRFAAEFALLSKPCHRTLEI